MSPRFDLARFIATYGTALAAVLVFCIFAATAPNFLNPTNLLNILKQISFLAILGLGFGLAFITAELDLSLWLTRITVVPPRWSSRMTSRNMAEIVGVATRVAVLKNGRKIADLPVDGITADSLAHLVMTGALPQAA